MWRYIFLFAFAFLPQPSSAAGLFIGPFCVDGGIEHVSTRDLTFVNEGKWTGIHFKKGSGEGGEPPMLVVFKTVPTPSTNNEACKDVIEREAQAGHHPLLAGHIERLDINGHAFEAIAGTNRFQIGAKGFRAKLGHVLQGSLSVAGGTTHLAGSKIWITNTTPILAEADKLTGEFEINAWNRTIEGAQVSMGGAPLDSVTLLPAGKKGEDIALRFDLHTGETRLWDCDLGANGNLTFAAASSSVSGLQLNNINANFSRMGITARNGRLTVSLRKLAGTVATGSQANSVANIEMSNAKFKLDALRGPAQQSPAGIAASGAELVGLQFDAEHGSISGNGGTAILEGVVSGTIEELTADALKADLRFKNPASSIISLLSGSAASDSVNLTLKREGDRLQVGGLIDTAALNLGKLLIKSATKLALRPATTRLIDPPPLEFPVDINVPPRSGTVDFRTEDYKVALTGRLDGFKLKGVLRVPLGHLEKTHLHVNAHNFALGIGAYAFLEPVIAGIKPTISDLDLSFGNPTAMDIGLKSTGRILTSVRAMVLGEPVFSMGEDGKKAKASLALQTTAGADLLYDLDRGRVLIGKADFVADNVRFHFLQPGGELDLNGTRLTNPDISLRHLEVHFVETADLEFGTAQLVAFSATGDRVYKPADPAKPTEVSFDAHISSPLRIGGAQALKVKYADALSLEALQITNFSFSVNNGSIAFGKDISVAGADIGISASSVNMIETNGNQVVVIGNARFTAKGRLDAGLNNRPDFHIALVASGPAGALSGQGDAEVAPFSGGSVSDIETGFKCEDGHTLSVPAEFDFAMAGIALVVHAERGQFSGIGLTGPTGLSMHTIRGAQCHNETKKIVIVPEQSGWTWGVCFDPFPYKCKWSWTTPEINIKYNFRFAVEFATATVFLPHPVFVFKEKKVKACYTGIAQLLAPAFAGGYTPQIVSNFPGADKVVNDILAAAFEPFESVLATSILNAVAASNIINLGQVLCYV